MVSSAIRPANDCAVSAFHSAVLARNCAIVTDGETTRRGRGDTDRERVSLIRRENTVLGAFTTICRGELGGAFE